MNTSRALVGSGFVAVGTLVLLDQQDVLDAGAVIADWWPVMFLLGALLELLSRPPRWISATVFGVVGLVLLGVTTDVLASSALAVLWPLGIIAVGLWLLLRRPGAAERAATSPEQTIDVVAMFSGRRMANTARRFRGGSVTAVFGGVEIDLADATIEGEATLDAVALFGGVDVFVPQGWRVVMDGPAIFGGHDSHVPAPTDPDAPTLRVRATALFGGVEVKLGRTTVAAAPPPATAAHV